MFKPGKTSWSCFRARVDDDRNLALIVGRERHCCCLSLHLPITILSETIPLSEIVL